MRFFKEQLNFRNHSIFLFFFIGISFLTPAIVFSQPSETLELNGDSVEYSMDGNKVIAKGNVVINYKKSTMTCDQVEMLRDSKLANASGHVVLKTDKGQITGDKISYNFETQTGEFNGANIITDKFFGYGRRVEKVSQNEMVMKNGYLTTCDLDKPHYRMNFKKINIIPKEKLVARGNTMVVGKMPVLYIPRFTQRLDGKEPFVSFTPGYTKNWGLFLLSDWRYYFNENVKANIHVDLREKRGVATGADLKYQIPNMGSGLIRTYYMNERKIATKRIYQETLIKPTYRERFKVEWRHKWEVDKSTNAILQYAKLSDADFLKDYFKKDFDRDSSPPTYFLLTKNFSNSVLSFRTDKRVNRFEGGVERLPEIRYGLANQKIADTRFYLKNTTTYSNLARKEASPTEVRLSTHRFDTDNEISYPTKLGFVEFTPFVGGRETFYSRTKDPSHYDSIRGIFRTGANLSTKFSKVYDANGEIMGISYNRLRHLITPTVAYSYVHDPTLSSSLLDIYDSIDSQSRSHKIIFGLENKLQTKRKDKIVDLVRMLVSTDFNLKEDPGKGSFNLINSEIELKPIDWLTFYFDSQYDAQDERLKTANFDIYINDPKANKWSFGIGKRLNTDVDDLLTTQLSYRINQKWMFKAYDRFDVEKGLQKEQEFVITRDLHCWEMDLSFSERRGQGSEILMVFRLKAFPELTFDFGNSFNKRKAGSQSGE